MKLSTKQAIRQALKKKKGKKSNKSSKIDNHTPDKPNGFNKIGATEKKGGKKLSIQNNVTVHNDSNNQSVVPISPEILDTKTKLSDKELRFIYFYMAGKITIEQAMIFAGYEGYGETYLEQLGQRIIARHECQVGDHRKIFRACGAGETAIAMGLLTLAREANSEMVRHNAWNSLAKCLGLSKEVLEGVEGIQIVINQGCAPASPEQPKDLPPSSGDIKIAF